MAADNTLELLIKLGVIGKEDVQAANDLLAETGKTTSGAAKATEDLGNEEKKTAEHAEHLHLNHRALHQIMHLIGKETAPELGHALAGAMLGPLGLALAVGYAIEGISEHVKKLNEDLDAVAEKAGEAFSKVKANLFDAIRAEEFNTEKVDKFFKKIEDDAARAQKAIESALKVLHEQESAQIKINKANEENELARVKDNPKLTAVQREAKAVDIKDRYARMNAGLEERGQQDEVNASRAELNQKQAELNNALARQQQNGVSPELITAVDKAMQSLPEHDKLRQQFDSDKAAGSVDYRKILTEWQSANAAQAAEKAKKDLGIGDDGKVDKDGDQGRLNKLKEANEKTIEQYRDRQKQDEESAKNAPDEDSRRFFSNMAGQYKHDADVLQDQIDTAARKVAADKALIEQSETAVKILEQSKTEQTKLNEEIEKLRQAVIAAQQKLNETATIAGIKNSATEKVTSLNEETGDLGLLDKLINKKSVPGETMEGILQKGESAMSALSAGKNLSEGQQDDYNKLVQLLASLGNSREKVNWILGALYNHVLSHDQELDNMKFQLAALAQHPHGT